MILGSGWGDFAETMQGALRIPYGEVPGFHTSTVPGHAGEWAFGELSGQKTAMMVGGSTITRAMGSRISPFRCG